MVDVAVSIELDSAKQVIQYDWEIPAILESITASGGQCPDFSTIHRILSDHVIIQGLGNDFRCLTCREYLDAAYGLDGLAALRLLTDATLKIGAPTDAWTGAENPGPFKVVAAEKHSVKFQLPDPWYHSKLETLQRMRALDWLCTAVRLPAPLSTTQDIHEDTGNFSKFAWTAITRRKLFTGTNDSLCMTPLGDRPFSLQFPNPSCWTKLFTRGVIIESPAPRTWGVGLELSFSLMVTLAGVENMYRIDGGTLLLGFFTALVPVSRHEETNSIQWHLETNRAGIDPRKLDCTRENWYRTTNTNVLMKARCFVGWFEKAHVMLGTRQLATDEARRLRWTGLTSRKETIRKVGHEIGAQGGFSMGPISIVAQGISVFATHANDLRYSAPRQFSEALLRDRQEVALVIDAESRRAWLVPLVSWILHLCHRYYIRQCGPGDTPIPFAEPSPDGAEATISAVKEKGDTVVFGAGTKDAETLRQLWLRISTNLGDSQPGREDPQRGLIFAAEAMDIMLSRDSYLKELPTSDVSASWAEFAKLAKTTTVCANLGNAIVPVPPSGKLCECCTLLESQDFLAAHTWSLARLLEVTGRSFSHLGKQGLPFENGTSWRVCNGLQGLWTDCPAGEECRNIWGSNAAFSPILQRLERVDRQKFKGKGVEEEIPIYDGQATESGVVVFGGYSEPMMRVTMPGMIKALNARFGSLELFAQRGMAGN